MLHLFLTPTLLPAKMMGYNAALCATTNLHACFEFMFLKKEAQYYMDGIQGYQSEKTNRI